MDLETLSTLISSVGFPIVAALVLGWFIWQMFQKLTAQSEEREKKLYEVVGEAQAVNEEMTATNARFIDILGTYKTDLREIKEDVATIKERINR